MVFSFSFKGFSRYAHLWDRASRPAMHPGFDPGETGNTALRQGFRPQAGGVVRAARCIAGAHGQVLA